jgi:molecular chaperone DnaJ
MVKHNLILNSYHHTLQEYFQCGISELQMFDLHNVTIVISYLKYIAILGIASNATNEEIKSAYFKLAKKHHPDISQEIGSKDKFSNIKEAYETLTNEKTRGTYDFKQKTSDFKKSYEKKQSNGYDGFNFNQWQSAAGEGFKPKDNFKDFFGEFDDYLNFRKAKESNKYIFLINPYSKRPNGQNGSIVKGKDVVLNIDLEFLEAINGTTKEVSFNKLSKCTPCNGQGKI